MLVAPSRFLAIAILLLGAGAIGWTSWRPGTEGPSVAEVRQTRTARATAGTDALEPIPLLGPADTLTNLDGWLNTDAESFEEIRARSELTVVQFWTFGCRNCKNTIEALQDIYDEFGDRIEIVGVHAPEFSYEAEVDNVVDAAAGLGVTCPLRSTPTSTTSTDGRKGPRPTGRVST